MKKILGILVSVCMVVGSVFISRANEISYLFEPNSRFELYEFNEGLARIGRGEQMGFMDKTGKVIIEPRFDVVFPFIDGLAKVRVQEGDEPISIDMTGKLLVPKVNPNWSKYYETMEVAKGLAIFKTEKSGKWGLIESSGKIIVEPMFEDIFSFEFSEGVFPVQIDGKWGYINEAGEVAIKPQFNWAGPFSDGMAKVHIAKYQNGSYWGDLAYFIDKTGKVVIEFEQNGIRYEKGLKNAVRILDQSLGYVDKTGKMVMHPAIVTLSEFHEGMLSIHDMSTSSIYKRGYISKTGAVISPIFGFAGDFSEGLAAVRIGGEDGKWGYIDKDGSYVIEPMLYHANKFSEGFAAVTTEKNRQTFMKNPLDIPESWAQKEVDAAFEAKLVPLAMQFGYKSNITRKDFCALVINLIEIKKGKSIDGILSEKGVNTDESPFVDTDLKTVIAANRLGIVNGKGNGKFDPRGTITRQEAAVMLANTAKALDVEINDSSSNFSDYNDISNWADNAVSFVSSKGIMGGTGNNKFSPQEFYTRQQTFITLLRLYKIL